MVSRKLRACNWCCVKAHEQWMGLQGSTAGAHFDFDFVKLNHFLAGFAGSASA